jgi:hypothetical protein
MAGNRREEEVTASPGSVSSYFCGWKNFHSSLHHLEQKPKMPQIKILAVTAEEVLTSVLQSHHIING